MSQIRQFLRSTKVLKGVNGVVLTAKEIGEIVFPKDNLRNTNPTETKLKEQIANTGSVCNTMTRDR